MAGSVEAGHGQLADEGPNFPVTRSTRRAWQHRHRQGGNGEAQEAHAARALRAVPRPAFEPQGQQKPVEAKETCRKRALTS